MTCGIYEIVNTFTGFRYVGQSKRIEERWAEHRQLLKRGEHRHRLLQQAWIEHGARRFKWNVLEDLSVLTSNKVMHARERVWQHKYGDKLYNEKGIAPEVGKTKVEVFLFSQGVPTITPRRHHLGPPDGMAERRVVMYSGRRDHIRLAEIRAETKNSRNRKK